MSKKTPKDVAMDVATFYDRIAWYVWKGCYQEANILRELAPWFRPPLDIDEARVERHVAQFIADERRLNDPINWS